MEVTKLKTVNIFTGYFFLLNVCIGTGFLGIPYAFFYSGYVAAIPTLLFIVVLAWVNANYLLEVMARAQVGEREPACLPLPPLDLPANKKAN